MRKSKILRAICFFLIVIVLYGLLSNFLTVTSVSDTLHINGFYLEPKNSLDVVLVGPSELYTGFSSPLAWKDNGFTSYAMTFSGVSVSLYKSMVTEILKNQKPKLLVFEVNGIIQTDEYMDKDSKKRIWLDTIPWSRNKLDTIKDKVPEDLRYSYYNKMSKYHSNWQHPLKCFSALLGKSAMKSVGYSYTKSFLTKTWEREDGSLEKYDISFTNQAETYLRELLDYCKEQGVSNVLFVRFPHGMEANNPEKLEEVASVINEYGYDYLNLENSYQEISLDTQKDFYNANHLNVYGMEKFTRYFSEYLCDNYDIKSEHPKEIKSQWDKCYEKTELVIADCKEKIKNGVRKTVNESAAYYKLR